MRASSQFNPARIHSSKGYNYAFAAKIWECMRRDDQLRDTLKELRSNKRSAAVSKAFQEAILGNRFAALVLGTATVPVSRDIDAVKDQIEHVKWPDLPAGLRLGFEKLTEQLAPLPRRVPSPLIASTKATESERDKELSLQLTRLWLKNADQIWNDWQVVAIPKIILHDRHQEVVLDNLNKIIAKTKRSWVRFKPGGSILGSAIDWDVYLFVEDLESSGVSRELALHQAAWRFYEKDQYAAYKGNRSSTYGKRFAKVAFDEHGGHTSTRYGAVKAAIKSVYPIFQLFAID